MCVHYMSLGVLFCFIKLHLTSQVDMTIGPRSSSPFPDVFSLYPVSRITQGSCVNTPGWYFLPEWPRLCGRRKKHPGTTLCLWLIIVATGGGILSKSSRNSSVSLLMQKNPQNPKAPGSNRNGIGETPPGLTGEYIHF